MQCKYNNYINKIIIVFNFFILVVSIPLLIKHKYYTFNPLISFAKAIILYQDELDEYKKIINQTNYQIKKTDISISQKSKNNIFVLIIGESTSRNHMQLYGYYRKTNPLLSKINKELYIFNDVISPHSHTNDVIKKSLTFKNYESKIKWYKHPTLLNCINKTGMKSYWLSNQEMFGAWGNVTAAIAQQADVTIYNDLR